MVIKPKNAELENKSAPVKLMIKLPIKKVEENKD